MTAQPKSRKRGASPEDTVPPSLADFLRPSRYPSLPPEPLDEDVVPATDDDAVEPSIVGPAIDDFAVRPESEAPSHAGSSLRPLTVDPEPPFPPDDEEELASLVPVSRLPARKIAVPVAAMLVVMAGAFAARRVLAPHPADARTSPVAAAAASAPPGPAVDGRPEEPLAVDDDDLDDEPPATPDQIASGQEAAREARRLLSAGQVALGVAEARKAIALNPADPQNYILLAAGLQDLGKWQEAKEIFSKCAQQSGGAMHTECRYFATQPRR